MTKLFEKITKGVQVRNKEIFHLVEEYKAWASGREDKLMNFYTYNSMYNTGFYDWKDFNKHRQRLNYFWSLSIKNKNIKRVHSGLPQAITFALRNLISDPKITFSNKLHELQFEDLCTNANLMNIVNDEQIQSTLELGFGAFKISVDKDYNFPIVQYYDASNVEFFEKYGFINGILFKTQILNVNNKNYELWELRSTENGNSYIEYELHEYVINNHHFSKDYKVVPLSTLEDTKYLKPICLKNYNKPLAVPCKYYPHKINPIYGKSIYEGKISLFDSLDEILSQSARATRLSTVKTYIDQELLEVDRNGNRRTPDEYDQNFVVIRGVSGNDNDTNAKIYTEQPRIDFTQYNIDANAKLNFILLGLLSPATLGIDLSKYDNAEAQREKEKITLEVRKYLIKKQTEIIKELIATTLDVYKYVKLGKFDTPINKNDIVVNYKEYANPSFESLMKILGQAYSQDQLSTERYVEELWKDTLTKEEKEQEVDKLKERKEFFNQFNE